MTFNDSFHFDQGTYLDCIRAPPKQGRYWEIHPWRPRDFPRPEGNLEGPEFWWSTDILLIINSSTGMDQEIHPCGQGRIDSVKINPSLLRMREWAMAVWLFVNWFANFDLYLLSTDQQIKYMGGWLLGWPLVGQHCHLLLLLELVARADKALPWGWPTLFIWGINFCGAKTSVLGLKKQSQ